MPGTERKATGRTRRARTLAVAAVVAATVVVALVLLGGDDGDDDGDAAFDRSGSVLLDEASSGLLVPEDPPGGYRIDYRVEGFGAGAPVVTADRLWVRRPFESRLEVFDTAEPGDEPDSVQVGTLGTLRADGEDTTVVVAAPPGPPASDTRVARTLPDALTHGRFELRERREVAGRPCQVIRSATLLASGDLAPPDGDDHADTCIDDRGLVLEELLVEDGEPLLRRVAVDVEIDPDLHGVSFHAGDTTVPLERGGGFVGRAEPDSRPPGRFFEPRAPDGFERVGRFVVIPPQHDNFTDISRRSHRLTYVSDVFVDGADVLVVDQGGTLGNVEPFPDLRGVRVDVEGLGSAIVTYGRSGPVVVVPRDEGRFVRARGTGAPDALIDLLEGLEEVEGGQLQLLDGDR